MLTPETIEKMNAMKLFGLVSAFETQLSSSEYKELSFEERVGLLVDAEWTAREQRKLSRRLRAAKLRYPACLENVNFQAPRGLNREQILSLGNCRFVGERHNLLITGPTGIGKSFLACAFVERACRRGFTGCYVRAPRLLHELAVARGDGSYARGTRRCGAKTTRENASGSVFSSQAIPQQPPETSPTSPGVRPRQVAAYGSGKVASRLSLRPLPPAPTCRPLLHNTQVR